MHPSGSLRKPGIIFVLTNKTETAIWQFPEETRTGQLQTFVALGFSRALKGNIEGYLKVLLKSILGYFRPSRASKGP